MHLSPTACCSFTTSGLALRIQQVFQTSWIAALFRMDREGLESLPGFTQHFIGYYTDTKRDRAGLASA